MKNWMQMLQRGVQPLASRKVRVGVATVLSGMAAQYGLGLGEETVMTILGVGVALILGIAHEDAGKNIGREAIHERPH